MGERYRKSQIEIDQLTGRARGARAGLLRPKHPFRNSPIRLFLFVILAALQVFFPAQSIHSAPVQALTPRLYIPMLTREVEALPGWLGDLNSFRAGAGLPDVTENPDWSLGGRNHARYMVKNDVIAHDEDPANPWFTPEGQAAGQSSDLMVSTSAAATDREALTSWMKAPFHALGLLDPELLQTGFGSFREADEETGGYEMGAAIDVVRGSDGLPQGVTFPVFWPGPGSSIPLARCEIELPDPLASCLGYELPAGLPVIAQFGAGDAVNETSIIIEHSFVRDSDGAELEHCVFDETSYANPSPDEQSLARSILAERDAAIIIPRLPLEVGQAYTVTVKTVEDSFTWSFTVTGDE